jgi:hypothetical protein
MPNVPLNWKAQLMAAGRQLATIVVAAIIVITFIALAFSAQGRQEREAVDELRRATLAQVCVLALPVREDGRSQKAVQECLIRYGLVEGR